MAISISQPQPRPYASRCKTDSNGQEHWHLYVPSAKGWAWIELFDLPAPDEALRDVDPEAYARSCVQAKQLRDRLLDPDCVEPWKVEWCRVAYLLYRQQCNASKRADISYSDWQEVLPAGGELYADQVVDPEQAYLAAEEGEQSRRVLAEVLLPLTNQQRKYLTLSLGNDMSYADIARLEHPDADQAQINNLADAVRNSVNRAKKRIHKMFGTTRPDLGFPGTYR